MFTASNVPVLISNVHCLLSNVAASLGKMWHSFTALQCKARCVRVPRWGRVKGRCTGFSIVSCHVSHCQPRDLQRGAFYTFAHLGEGESDCVTELTNNQTFHLLTHHSDRSWRPKLGLWVLVLIFRKNLANLYQLSIKRRPHSTQTDGKPEIFRHHPPPAPFIINSPRNMEAMYSGPCCLDFPPFSHFPPSLPLFPLGPSVRPPNRIDLHVSGVRRHHKYPVSMSSQNIAPPLFSINTVSSCRCRDFLSGLVWRVWS